MMITRSADWPLLLDALIYSRLHTPFRWGAHDCCLFAADCIQAMTGADPARKLRGLTVRRSMRFVKDCGGMVGLAIHFLGAPTRGDSARVGDIVAIPAGGRVLLAVCTGRDRVVAPGPMGLSSIALKSALCAWRVG